LLLVSHFICISSIYLQECMVIWVLTAGFGDGHNTAARSVAEGLRRASPSESVVYCDLLDEVHPVICAVLRRGYQLAIIRFPKIWQWLYGVLAKPGVCGAGSDWLQPVLRAMSAKIAAEKPRAIVSTYPIYAGLLEVLRNRGESVPPLITIITDSISVHPIWLSAPSEAYLLPDEETRLVVSKLLSSVPTDKLHVTGFPVSLAFTDSSPGPDSNTRRILYLPSTPVDHVAATLEALRPLLEKGVRMTLPVGKHAPRLYHTLRRLMDSSPQLPIDIIGWTDQMPRFLQSHDVIICKAGGAILHEVLAARIPVVIDYVVPGQEEGNAEMILQHRCGLRSLTPQQTAESVASILADGAILGETMRQNMKPISVPDASAKAAKVVLEVALQSSLQ
jgi:processive 1,2-diacylglycerol beta-glucosyltransferase